MLNRIRQNTSEEQKVLDYALQIFWQGVETGRYGYNWKSETNTKVINEFAVQQFLVDLVSNRCEGVWDPEFCVSLVRKLDLGLYFESLIDNNRQREDIFKQVR